MWDFSAQWRRFTRRDKIRQAPETGRIDRGATAPQDQGRSLFREIVETGRSLLERGRRVRRFVQHHRAEADAAVAQDRKRRERMTQTPDIGAGDQDRRDRQGRDEIEHGRRACERHHQTADAFDQENILGGRWRHGRSRQDRQNRSQRRSGAPPCRAIAARQSARARSLRSPHGSAPRRSLRAAPQDRSRSMPAHRSR